MENLEKLLEMTDAEFGAIAKNGKFKSREEIDSVYKLMDIAKDVYCIWQYEDDMEGGESEMSYAGGSYARDGRGGNRGGNRGGGRSYRGGSYDGSYEGSYDDGMGGSYARAQGETQIPQFPPPHRGFRQSAASTSVLRRVRPFWKDFQNDVS